MDGCILMNKSPTMMCLAKTNNNNKNWHRSYRSFGLYLTPLVKPLIRESLVISYCWHRRTRFCSRKERSGRQSDRQCRITSGPGCTPQDSFRARNGRIMPLALNTHHNPKFVPEFSEAAIVSRMAASQLLRPKLWPSIGRIQG